MTAPRTTAGPLTTASLKTIETSGDIAMTMREIGCRARAAACTLALAVDEQKNAALHAMADAIRARTSDILAANAEDIAEARAGGATAAFIDRLWLDDKRAAAMAEGVAMIATLHDPVGTVTESW